MTKVLQQMATGSLKGTDKRSGGVALEVKGCFDCLECNVRHTKVECLWISWLEPATDHRARVKTLMTRFCNNLATSHIH